MKNLYISVAVVATVLSTNPANVYARSQAAFLGSARHGSQQNCFYELSGGPVQKNCSRVAWVVPILYDHAGRKTLTVKARGVKGTTRNVSCRFYSTTSSGTTIGGNADFTKFYNGTIEAIRPSGYAMGSGGTWLTCNMDKGTRMYHVDYPY